MLNQFAKLLLVATSLSPVLGAVAVNQFALGKPWTDWLPWLAVGLLLVFICWALLRHLAATAQSQLLKLAQFENNDKEVLAFLLTYLLPFVSAKRVSCSTAAIFGLRGWEPGSPRCSGDLREKPGLRISSRLA